MQCWVLLESRVLILLPFFFPHPLSLQFNAFVIQCSLLLHSGDYNYEIFYLHEPDETDIEFRTVVIAIELISQSGDHILLLCYFFYFFFTNKFVQPGKSRKN